MTTEWKVYKISISWDILQAVTEKHSVVLFSIPHQDSVLNWPKASASPHVEIVHLSLR